MLTLEVVQKTIRTNMYVIVIELGIRKAKGFRSFVQL